MGPVIGGWGPRQQLSSRLPLQKAPRRQALEAHAEESVTDKRKVQADPLALQVSEFPDGRAARVAGTGRWAEGGAQLQEKCSKCRGGVGRSWLRHQIPLLQGPHFGSSLLHLAPSLSSSRDHQTFPEIYPHLVGTHCSHNMPGAIKEDSTLDGPCIPAVALSAPRVGALLPGLWVPPLPSHPASLTFTGPLPRGHMLWGGGRAPQNVRTGNSLGNDVVPTLHVQMQKLKPRGEVTGSSPQYTSLDQAWSLPLPLGQGTSTFPGEKHISGFWKWSHSRSNWRHFVQKQMDKHISKSRDYVRLI